MLDEAVLKEEEYSHKGWVEGIAYGRAAGQTDGFDAACAHGFELGTEAGFYKGVLLVLQHHHTWVHLSHRCQAHVQQLDALIASLPLYQPHESALVDNLHTIRRKFKQLAAMLGIARSLGVITDSGDQLSF